MYLYFFQIAMDEKLSWNSRGTEIVQLIISVLMDFQVTLFLSLSLPHDNKLLFSLADGLRNLFFYQTGHYKINSSPSLQHRGERTYIHGLYMCVVYKIHIRLVQHTHIYCIWGGRSFSNDYIRCHGFFQQIPNLLFRRPIT